jgi:hypothetical protein
MTRARQLSLLIFLSCVSFQSLACLWARAPIMSELQSRQIPVEAQQVAKLSSQSVQAFQKGNTLWLKLTDTSLSQMNLSIPRLCAPLRAIGWLNDSETKVDFTPEIDHWVFSWKALPKADGLPVLRVDFDAPPKLLEEATPITASADGSVLLPAHEATTVGQKLRYEPQWYKNTVGYWTVATDYVEWSFSVDQPGDFSVATLQGCGSGQGGSDVKLTVQQNGQTISELSFVPTETGHFQNFIWSNLGKVQIAQAGNYQLRIQATKIAKAAVMDIRAIHLVRQAK